MFRLRQEEQFWKFLRKKKMDNDRGERKEKEEGENKRRRRDERRVRGRQVRWGRMVKRGERRDGERED